jgi:flagellar hook-length control protein FliK
MEFIIAPTPAKTPATRAEKSVQPADTGSDDQVNFGKVLQDEEKKNAMEAEALMMAMLQKPQTSPLNMPALSGVEGGNVGLPAAAASPQLVLQVIQSVDLQTLAANGAQLDPGAVEGEISIDFVSLLGEAAEDSAGEPLNLREWAQLQSKTQVQTGDVEGVQVDAEKTQRIDQVTRAFVQEAQAVPTQVQAVETGKEFLTKAVTVQSEENQTVVKQENPVPNPAMLGLDTLSQSKMNSIEPARLAEAQPRLLLNQVSEQVQAMWQQGNTSLHLQLHPKDLGKIDIRLTHTSQGLGVSVQTDQASTGKLLEAHLDQLRQSLQSAGIQLANLQVGQHQQQAQRQPWQTGKPNHHGSRNAEGGREDLPVGVKQIRTSNGIDYRV